MSDDFFDFRRQISDTEISITYRVFKCCSFEKSGSGPVKLLFDKSLKNKTLFLC